MMDLVTMKKVALQRDVTDHETMLMQQSGW